MLLLLLSFLDFLDFLGFLGELGALVLFDLYVLLSHAKCSKIEMLQILRQRLTGVQGFLNFEHAKGHPSFANANCLGRVSVIGCALGILWGFHLCLSLGLTYLIFVSDESVPSDLPRPTTLPLTILSRRLVPLWQWTTYVVVLCSFHLLEFFVTLLYNPSVASADSFLVNHSTAYTAAALTSWIEFWLRFFLLSGGSRSVPWTAWLGLVGVLLSQFIRSSAISTAAESFNHIIQTSKKENHKLVSAGIYRYLRHPSYVGFFYWSIFTQVLLGNYAHAVLFAVASWKFFQKRIEYEEESLCRFFPEYPDYVSRSYMGIPFLYTKIDYSSPGKKVE